MTAVQAPILTAPTLTEKIPTAKILAGKILTLTILALIIFAIPLAAQNVDFNNNSNYLDPLPSAPVATSAPARKKPERVFDTKLFIVMGSLGAAESLRFTTRKIILEREYAAGAPWVNSVPSNQRTIPKDLALYGSEFLVAYELKKSHSWLPGDRVIRKLWWVYPAAMTAIHLKNGIENIRTQAPAAGPGGCTSVAQCTLQMQNQ